MINTNSADPSRLIFYHEASGQIEIKDDVQVYATFVAPSAELNIDDDAQVFGSLRGKKLKLDRRGQFHHDLSPSVVDVSLAFVDQGGSDYDLAATDQVEIKKNGIVTGLGVTARLSTNSIEEDMLKVKDDAVVTGDAYVGPFGDVNTVIKIDGSGLITGSKAAMSHSVTIPDIDEPTLGASVGDVTYSSGTTTISSDLHCDKLTIKDDAIVDISGDVKILTDDDVSIEDTAQIRLLGSSTLELYTKKDAIVEADAQINVNTTDPTLLTWYHLPSNTLELIDRAKVYGTIISPAAEFNVNDDAIFYGTVRAYEIKIESDGQAHVSFGQGEGQSATGTASQIIWLERP